MKGDFCMSQDVMMQLGDVQFTVSGITLNEQVRNKLFRYASQDTLGSGVRHQYLGRGLETMSLDAVIFQEGLRNALGKEEPIQTHLLKLDTLASSGKPAPLYDGLGNTYGNWVIQSLSETGNEYTKGGQLLKKSLRLELSRVEGV